MLGLLPFDFNGWDIQDTFCWTFYDVTFSTDFGDFSEGDFYSNIDVDLQADTMTAHDDRGNVIKKVHLRLTFE